MRTKSSVRRTILWGVVTFALAATARAEDLGFKVPEGFEVSLYADDALAHDVFSMTIDAHGRVVVAGPNYVKTLKDTDNDGMFEIPQWHGQEQLAALGLVASPARQTVP